MRRLFRYTLITFLIAAALIAIAMTYLASRLNSETVLPLVQQQLKQHTGLSLRSAGDMHWRLFPRLRIEISALSLHTEHVYAGDSLFTEIDSFELGIDWKKLLDRELRFESLAISDATLRLVKPASDKGNWQALAQKPANKQLDSKTAPAQAQNIAALALVFDDLTLENVTIEYHDLASAISHEVVLNNLQASHIQLDGRPFKFALAAQYRNSDAFGSQLSFASSLSVDAKSKALHFSSINGKLDSSQFNGEINVSAIAQNPVVNAALQFAQVNLNRYQDDNNSTTINETPHAETKKQDPEQSPLLALFALPNANLELQIARLQYNNIDLNNVVANANINKGYVSIKPVTADAFGGKITVKLTLDGSAATPVLRIHSNFESLQLDQLLSSFEVPPDLSGTLTFNADTTMQGSNTNQWLRSLNGSSNIAITQGVYHKDNIEHRVCQAIALARNEKLSSQWPANTPFNTANANIQWRNGIGEITAVTGGLDNMRLSGTGRLSAIDPSASLRLRAIITGDLAEKDPGCAINEKYRAIAWPIHCTANTDSSQCRIDQGAMEKIIKTNLQNELQQVINKKLGEQLGETLRQLLK